MFERRRLRVYIAGPISKGDVVENVWNGVRWGRRMLRDGLAPYVPHLDAYMTLQAAHAPGAPGSNWQPLLEWDLELVAVSEAFFRIAGESAGADLEMKVAQELGIPVFHEYIHDEIPFDLRYGLGTDYDHDWPDYEDLLEYASRLGLRGRRVYVD